jgi:hypothetical protein
MTTTRTTDKEEEEEEEEKRLMEKYDRALTSNGVRKRRGLRLFASSPSEEEEEEEEEFFELDAKALFSSYYRGEDDRLHLVAFANDDNASSIRGEVETIGFGDGGKNNDSREKILRERNARLDEDVRRVRDLLERLKTNRMEHRVRGEEREEENGGNVGSISARGGKERTRFLLPSVERTTTRGRETIIKRWSIPAEELVARSVGLQPRDDDDDDDDDRDKNENENNNAQLKAAVAATSSSSTTTKASPPLSAESLRLAGVLL